MLLSSPTDGTWLLKDGTWLSKDETWLYVCVQDDATRRGWIRTSHVGRQEKSPRVQFAKALKSQMRKRLRSPTDTRATGDDHKTLVITRVDLTEDMAREFKADKAFHELAAALGFVTIALVDDFGFGPVVNLNQP